MSLGKHSFDDLESIIDRVHALFDVWEQHDVAPSGQGTHAFYRTKLAVHEWLANLVQHADFGNRVPRISMEVSPNGEQIHCVIEDNSIGFNLNAELDARQEILNRLPDRGMGLLLLRSCTGNLSYQQVDDTVHRLEFTVSSDQENWFDIPFEL